MAPKSKELRKTFKARNDGWENALTGVGSATRDKRSGATINTPSSSSDHQGFEDLYHGDDICATIAELPAKEMVRKWFNLKVDDSEAPDPANLTGRIRDAVPPPQPAVPGEDPKAKGKKPGKKVPRGDAEEIDDLVDEEVEGRAGLKPKPGSKEADESTGKVVMQAMQELKAQTRFYEAKLWARVFGGSLMFLGVDDGAKNLAQELREDSIRSFDFISVFDRWDVQPYSYYTDENHEKFGQVEVWTITSTAHPDPRVRGGRRAALGIHETRFIKFDGVQNNRRRRLRNQGWGDSIYVRIREVVRDYAMAWGGAAHLLQDFSQAVFKIKGLADMLASDGAGLVRERMMLMDLCRSMVRAVPLDAESESFERSSTPVSGMPELMDRFALRIAAAARMPVSLLFGDSPGGLNATGEANIRFFYDSIASEQEQDLTPKVMRVLELLFKAADGPTNGKEPDNWSIEWNPLWQLDDLQQAQLRKTQADTDAVYISNNVITPDEVAKSRFGGDKYSTETVLDLAQREADKVAEEAAIEEGLLDPHTRQLKTEDEPAPGGKPETKLDWPDKDGVDNHGRGEEGGKGSKAKAKDDKPTHSVGKKEKSGLRPITRGKERVGTVSPRAKGAGAKYLATMRGEDGELVGFGDTPEAALKDAEDRPEREAKTRVRREAAAKSHEERRGRKTFQTAGRMKEASRDQVRLGADGAKATKEEVEARAHRVLNELEADDPDREITWDDAVATATADVETLAAEGNRAVWTGEDDGAWVDKLEQGGTWHNGPANRVVVTKGLHGEWNTETRIPAASRSLVGLTPEETEAEHGPVKHVQGTGPTPADAVRDLGEKTQDALVRIGEQLGQCYDVAETAVE